MTVELKPPLDHPVDTALGFDDWAADKTIGTKFQVVAIEQILADNR